MKEKLQDTIPSSLGTSLPRRLRPHSSFAIAGIIIVMIWTAIGAKYFENRHWDYATTTQVMQNFTLLSEENVQRSIGEIDKALLYMRKTIENRKDTTDYNVIVRTTDLLSEIIVQVAIIDENGMMRASNVGPNPSPLIDLSDRVHYLVHRNSNQDFLYVSQPVLGRSSKKWSVQFTRRLRNRDGSFAGVVVASLDPAHFSKTYGEVDLGPSASISMIGKDGVVRSSASRGGTPRFALSDNLNGTGFMEPLRASPHGIFEMRLARDDEPRLTAFRRVQGHPLVVTVSLPRRAIFTSANNNLVNLSIAGGILTVIALIASQWIGSAERAAESKGRQLATTLRQMSQGLMMVDDNRHIAVMNEQCLELLGIKPEQVPGLPRSGRLPPAKNIRVEYEALAEVAGLPVKTGDQRSFEHATPHGLVLEVTTRPLERGGFVRTFSDITERKAAEVRVMRLASKDTLTDILNRRVFQSELEKALSRMREAPKPRRVGVLLLDIDRFKFVNDTLGHVVGDALLIGLAERLQSHARPESTIARLGGDEFALMMELDDNDDMAEIAQDLLTRLSGTYSINEHLLNLTVSIGVATAPSDGDDAEQLLIAADLALYAAKADGRATYRVHTSDMNEVATRRSRLESALIEALEQKQFELHFQPIIDLSTGEPSSMEALVRWRHPEDGMVSPGLFIPAAEETGLIIPLGEWILREACRNAALWPGSPRVSVNISAVQLLSENLYKTVCEALQDSGLPPERLELEITESTLMKDDKRTTDLLFKLKKLGLSIAMDDFGTGYSSLSYLQSFPFDKIKIDRTFIAQVEQDNRSEAIVRAVVDIASNGGMRTTAEGIETAQQQGALTSLGCDEGQGFLFSRPLPAAEAMHLLENWQPLLLEVA